MTIPFHTPEELRLLSNIGHTVEGLLLGTVALIAFAQAIGFFPTTRMRYLWPGVLVLAGLFLPSFVFIHPTLEIMIAHVRIILADQQQQQHLVMALLLLLSGISEVLAIRRHAPRFHRLRPAALFVTGVLFIIHPQHGSGEAVHMATSIHRWLGSMSIASGISRAIEVRAAADARWSRIAWPLFLLVTAIFLLIYREPPGAFEVPSL